MNKKVIVIWAWFGWLGSAILLARAWYDVTVVEKNDKVWGRANLLERDGYRRDMWPSWYLMPDAFDRYFTAIGRKVSDYLDLQKLEPSYRVFFKTSSWGTENLLSSWGGTTKEPVSQIGYNTLDPSAPWDSASGWQAKYLDLYADVDKAATTFEGIESGSGDKLRAYLKSAAYQYGIAMEKFVFKNFDSIWDFMTPQLAIEWMQLNVFTKLYNYVSRFVKNENLKKLLMYPSVFLGTSPYETPALFNIMSHVDFNQWVFYPQGWIHEIPKALYQIALEEGVKFEFNAEVEKIIVEDKKVTWVKLYSQDSSLREAKWNESTKQSSESTLSKIEIEKLWLIANNSVTQMKIISVKKCDKKYLFHGSGTLFDELDPNYNHNGHWSYEFTVPVAFAWINPSTKFCYQPTAKYLEAKNKYWWAFHRLLSWWREILLWWDFWWYIYVFKWSDFYEVIREDTKLWITKQSTEYITIKKQKPIFIYNIKAPIDWESFSEYEYLWAENVGWLEYERFKKICLQQWKSELLKSVDGCLAKDTTYSIPEELLPYVNQSHLKPADIIISNADMRHTETQLLESSQQTYPESYWAKQVISPSWFILYLWVDGELPQLKHHTLVFSDDRRGWFDQIFKDPQWPQDPNYYICNPSKTDPSVAPAGKENLFVLVPIAPWLESTLQSLEAYKDHIIADIAHNCGIPDLQDRIEVSQIFSIPQFEQYYNAYKGTALGLAHTFFQSAVRRPQNYSKKVKGLYYAGGYTTPGIGMPMCLISAMMVADRVEKNK